eukprot:14265808-Heterocapsa_arctica.AAC.1
MILLALLRSPPPSPLPRSWRTSESGSPCARPAPCAAARLCRLLADAVFPTRSPAPLFFSRATST